MADESLQLARSLLGSLLAPPPLLRIKAQRRCQKLESLEALVRRSDQRLLVGLVTCFFVMSYS
jgi:hypothetical protein